MSGPGAAPRTLAGHSEVALAGGVIEEDGPLRLRVLQAIEGLPCLHRDRAPDGARGACALAMSLVDKTDGTPVP